MCRTVTETQKSAARRKLQKLVLETTVDIRTVAGVLGSPLIRLDYEWYTNYPSTGAFSKPDTYH